MSDPIVETLAANANAPVDSAITSGIEKLLGMIEVPDPLQPLVTLIGDNAWLGGLLAVLVFLALAKVVEWILIPAIKRLTSRTDTQIDDVIVLHLRRPLYWTVALLGVLIASSVLGIEQGRNTLISFILSVLIYLWMLFGLRVSKALLAITSEQAQTSAVVRPQTLPLFTNLAAIAVIAVAVYLIFLAWNIDMTAWLASAGILGIAIGFAAKDTLANLFSGVFIMADSPYKIGDYVVLDDGGGLRGKVTHIGIRSTRLLTRDDVEVTIPNSIMGNSKVVNESGGPHLKYRIRVAVGVAYGSDIDLVREVLMKVAEASGNVCEDPEPRVRFRAFGGSSLDFELLCWVQDPELRGKVLDELNCAVYKAFKAAKIEIPYSKHDLYIKEMPSRQADLPLQS